MAPSGKLARARTHTLSDDPFLQPSSGLPRRKSSSSLPLGPRGRSLTAASAAAAVAAATRPSATVPTTPSIDTSAAALLSPWGGTFLDTDNTPAPTSAVTEPLPSPSPSPSPFPPQLKSPSSASLRAQLLQSKPLPPHPPQPPPPSRDSFISIVDDPFFQRYHSSSTTTANWLDEDPFSTFSSTLSSALSFDTSPVIDRPTDPQPLPDDGEKPRHDPSLLSDRPTPQRDSLVLTDRDLWSPPPRKMEAVNIAVIGADGVGKTSFIQRALRLTRPPTSNISAIRLDVKGIPHVVALIELDLEYFDLDASQKVRWPKQINGHMVPRIDGALMLYDVMNKDSIRDLPPTLSALNNSGLPTILVATKCDNPESIRQLNADGLATVFPSIITDFKTSANVSTNTRDCLQAIILAVYNRKGAENSHDTSTRRRAASSAAHLDAPPPDSISGHPLSSRQNTSKHSRASSDLSLLRGTSAGSAADRDSYYRGQGSRSPQIEYPNTPQLTSSFSAGMSDNNSSSDAVQDMLRSTGVRLDASQASFLFDVDESDAESYRYSEDLPSIQRPDEILYDNPPKPAGTTLDDLVDRLLAAPMTRADINFADVFLCLYRKFAAPSEVLSAILARLYATWDDTTSHHLERTATQLRMIEVIARWVSLYPGDFARPGTRHQLEMLVRRLSSDPVFFVAANQIHGHLENDVIEDDDTGWARSDDLAEEGLGAFAGNNTTPRSPVASGLGASFSLDLTEGMRSMFIGHDATSTNRQPSSETGGGSGSGNGNNINKGNSNGNGNGNGSGNESSSSVTGGGNNNGNSSSILTTGTTTASGATVINAAGPGSGLGSGSGPLLFQFHSYEEYEKEALNLVPISVQPLNKFRYRIFMDQNSDDVADEITRIDWVMFSSIRIRDLVRHVSLPLQEKERCRSLKNVNRMISHFNHVAKWVSNMILIRDKAKHRALCLQKFMDIAQRLRKLNNYNGLAAVLAGINGTAIHRLAQTRALVDNEKQKQFARLVLLMGTQKSHFAYRLAWENSSLPRIPFIPLHRRDLVSAEEGSRTFVGPQNDRINWKKFEVLGEVLLPIMKSQGTPYPNLKKHEASRELVLDCRMPTDDEEIYQRSVQVEPAGVTAEASKKKFPWLQK